MIGFIIGLAIGAAVAAYAVHRIKEERALRALQRDIQNEVERANRIMRQQFKNLENYNGTEDGQEDISYE